MKFLSLLTNILKFIFKLPKKYLIGIFLVLLLGFFFLRPKDGKNALEFANVKKQDIRAIVSSSGTLTGKEVANLKFRSAGKLASINVQAGTIVSEGEVIATLDTQDLSIRLQQAQNTLRDKQATVDKVLDDLKDNDDEESYTERQTRTSAQAARDSAVDAVKEAQRAFQDAVIYSPISGLVTQANGISGQNVSSADLIAQVVDNSKIILDTDIDESDIGKVSVGQVAEVTLDAYENQTFKGSVDQILPQTKTTSSGATVVTVRISLNTSPKTFVNGLTGQASIVLAEAKNVLTIPQEALREDNIVVVQKNGKLEEVKVVAGIQSDTDIEIKEGLKEGDKVLLNPPATLNPNQGKSGLQLRIGR